MGMAEPRQYPAPQGTPAEDMVVGCSRAGWGAPDFRHRMRTDPGRPTPTTFRGTALRHLVSHHGSRTTRPRTVRRLTCQHSHHRNLVQVKVMSLTDTGLSARAC